MRTKLGHWYVSFFFSLSLSVAREEAKIGLKPAFRSRALCSRCEPDSSYACLAVPRGAPAGRQKGSPFRSVVGTRAVVVKQAPGGAVQGTTSNSCKEHIEAKQCGAGMKDRLTQTCQSWWRQTLLSNDFRSLMEWKPSADSFTRGLSGLHKTWHFWKHPYIHKNSRLYALLVLQTASSRVFGFAHPLATLSGKMFNYSTNS